MAIQVKNITAVVQKWQTNAGAATPYYTAGINAPKQDQAQAAISQAGVWQAAVSQAQKAFTQGLEKASQQGKWKANSLSKGAQRYAGGITAGIAAFTSGMGAVLQVIAGVNLPAKGPKGSPANVARVSAVNDALRAAKVAGQL